MTDEERHHFRRAVVIVCSCTIAVMGVLTFFILRNAHRIEDLQRAEERTSIQRDQQSFQDNYRSCLQRNQLRAALLLIARRESKEEETPDDLKRLYRTFEEVLVLRDCRPVLTGDASRTVRNATQAQIERALRTGDCLDGEKVCPFP